MGEASAMSDEGKPFTTGWKVAVVVAILLGLGNSGVDRLRSQEERRFRNHEKRIDALENEVRQLRRDLKTLTAQPPTS